MKKTYEAPAVVELGSVIELTQAQLSGTKLDGNFSAGTPLSAGILS